MQALQAQSFFETLTPRDPGFISLIVLCEFAWVLGRSYHRTRVEVVAAVGQLLNIPVFTVERAEIALKALQQFRTSKADFGDCCIGAIAQAAGCDYTVTFDKNAAKLPGMRALCSGQA